MAGRTPSRTFRPFAGRATARRGTGHDLHVVLSAGVGTTGRGRAFGRARESTSLPRAPLRERYSRRSESRRSGPRPDDPGRRSHRPRPRASRGSSGRSRCRTSGHGRATSSSITARAGTSSPSKRRSFGTSSRDIPSVGSWFPRGTARRRSSPALRSITPSTSRSRPSPSPRPAASRPRSSTGRPRASCSGPTCSTATSIRPSRPRRASGRPTSRGSSASRATAASTITPAGASRSSPRTTGPGMASSRRSASSTRCTATATCRSIGPGRASSRSASGQIVGISTAGEPGSDFEQTRERIRQLAGTTSRRGSFLRAASGRIVLHEWSVGEDEDVEDFRVVKRANPFSGVTSAMLAEKFASPTMTMGHWLRFVCNRPTRGEDSAITEAEWAKARTTDEIPAGEPVWLGLDVAWKWDTTAAVPLWWRDSEYRLFGPAEVLVPPRDGTSLDPHLVESAHARHPCPEPDPHGRDGHEPRRAARRRGSTRSSGRPSSTDRRRTCGRPRTSSGSWRRCATDGSGTRGTRA